MERQWEIVSKKESWAAEALDEALTTRYRVVKNCPDTPIDGVQQLQLEWSCSSSAKWGAQQLENGHWSKLLPEPR
jgi:hypothetical protein